MKLLKKVIGYFSIDLAMDLGTANTLAYITEKGIVEPNKDSIMTLK